MPEQPEEGGMPVMMGEIPDALGGGKATMTEVDVLPQEAAPASPEPSEQEMITQTEEETVAVPEKKKEETNLETKQSNDTSQYPQVVQKEAIAVDAACSGNPGPMEYRGVYLRTGQQIFHFGPIHGTNNIGEFLAIVHALALLKKQGLSMPIYSDSRNAIGWIKQKKCKTKLERNARTEEVFQMIDRAESWLKNNSYNTQVLKWNTSEWGEVPADFGRK